MANQCDLFRVADQVGIRLLRPDQRRGDRPRECFCKSTLRQLGREHGEQHLRLVLRLVVESAGNAAALQADVIRAVSSVVLSELVEIRADMLDEIDLLQLRAWAARVRPGCSTGETIAAALLWRLAPPERLFPSPDPAEIEEERRRLVARKGRQNATKRRLARYAGAEAA